jgi:hypothetical protein
MMVPLMSNQEQKPAAQIALHETAMIAGGIGAAGTVLASVLFLVAFALLRTDAFAGLAQLVGAVAGLCVGFCLQNVLRRVDVRPPNTARRWLAVWLLLAFAIAGGLLFDGVVSLFGGARWWVLAIMAPAPALPATALALCMGNRQPLYIMTALITGVALAAALLATSFGLMRIATPDSVLIWVAFTVLAFAPAIWLAAMTLFVLRIASTTQRF